MPDFEYCRKCHHLLPGEVAVCPHCGATRRRSGRRSRRRPTLGADRRAVALIAVGVATVIAISVLVFLSAGTP